MSYSIIFDTKFIKLEDGRLLHLNRSGCNNDTSGRELSDYRGKIYTEEEIIEYAKSFMKDGKSESWELKIRSKYCTLYEYGEHLLRMVKKAINYNQFCDERFVKADRYDGVEIFKPEEKFLLPEEFDKKCYDYLYSGKPFRYRRVTTRLNSEKEIIDSLEKGQSIEFYVGKKYKKSA